MQARRDSGLKRLREVKFKVDGTQIELQLFKFKDIRGTGLYTYVTSGGSMDTLQDIQATINSRFKGKESAIPEYHIQKVVTAKVSTGTFVVSFTTLAMMSVKSIEVSAAKQF
ncbi:hypothetical protein BDDG_09603 [Blastomyces dermatitidis ATCC 18188]|uniref:Uncharacterized protein n=1 Tax=Ajellomyces dermatitidis (strain ATCC 18188 / CBS 674.68) TaxID=653446 RepID=F2TTU3_AJEDA|nr:hypothetical protein BDDG_09603 [Blastomyces dermatitidis ATCC 18188]